MRRKMVIIIILSILCLLIGCGRGELAAEEPPAGVSAGESLIEGLPMQRVSVAFETPYGTFLGGNMIRKISPDGSTLTPLCSKPGCSHNYEDSAWECDACFVTGDSYGTGGSPDRQITGNIGFFRDRVYKAGLTPDLEPAVFSMDPVTGERRQELLLDWNAPFPEPKTYVQIKYLFHENTMVMFYYGSNNGEDGTGRTYIMLLDLPTLTLRTAFEEHMDMKCGKDYMCITDPILLEGHCLYAMEQRGVEDALTRYDLQTGETKDLLRFARALSLDVDGDMLYYLSDSGEFVELNMETEEQRTVSPEEGVVGAIYTSDLIVTTSLNWDSLFQWQETGETDEPIYRYTFYDRNYRKLDSIGFLEQKQVFCITDSAVCFLERSPAGEAVGVQKVNRADFGSGTLELKPTNWPV